MYACICHAVTEDVVARAVDRGALTVDEVGDATFAGTGCGGCHQSLVDIIDKRCRICPLAALQVA